MSDPYFTEGNTLISYSGGRSSGYMLRRTIDAHGGTLPPGVRVIFANTGKERAETLDFVRECAERWAIPILWAEYVPKRGGDRVGYRFVTYETASREGEPFIAMMDAERYVPNQRTRLCTKNLKVLVIEAVMRDFGLEPGEYTEVIGFRADEPSRVARARESKENEDRLMRFPMHDAGITQADVLAFWNKQPFNLRLEPHESNCDLCLAGETEVVTSDGIRPIRELAGTSPELLVPKMPSGSISETGSFVRAPVRSFGMQRLWRIELAGHGGARKTIYATGEHRWLMAPRKGSKTATRDEVPTRDLRPGDRLKNLNRCPIGEDRGNASRIAAMQGFVFGDGAVAQGERPGTIDIHDGPKLRAMGPLFTAICGDGAECFNDRGTMYRHFYGIPRAWKHAFPDMRESRHFLMGWLSGWFAADGCVSEDGNCILNSATREHLEFARSLCAVLGVSCSQIRGGMRTAVLPSGREMEAEIYALNLSRFHLTADFFWLEHHRARIEANSGKEERRYGWTVASVEETDRVEEVFCATVEGVGAFGLADGLMTGNCFLKGNAIRLSILRKKPERADWWIAQEALRGHGFTKAGRKTYAELKAKAITSVQPSLPFVAEPATEDDISLPCGCHD